MVKLTMFTLCLARKDEVGFTQIAA